MTTKNLPRFWPFLLAFPIAIVSWVSILEFLVKPDGLVSVSTPAGRRLLWWIIPPLIFLAFLFLTQWGHRTVQALKEARAVHSERQAQILQEKAAAAVAQTQRDHEHFALEIYGLGCSVDRYNQDQLWDLLREGTPHASILPQDPKAYPWGKDAKRLYGAGSLRPYETAISQFPEKWELPFLLAGPPLHNQEDSDDLKATLCGARSGGGMHWHRFRTVSQTYDECPDQLPTEAFRLFDQYGSLPAAAIAVGDSLVKRNSLRPTGSAPLLKDGYREPGEMTASSTVILLGRRDRVEVLRPTATKTPIRDIWIPIEWASGLPEDTYDDFHIPSYDDAPPEPPLPAHSAFKPSRYVKRPWCKEQLAQFDELKVLARLHRPQTAQYQQDGNLLKPSARQAVFLAAWQAALATLPTGQWPVRVIYDFGPKGAARLAPLVLAINAVGPDLDVTGEDGLDVTERMGDTCANAPYLALALGVLASRDMGGVSAVVNLRREDRATVMMVSPP
jgi:hypothetical protein